MFLDELQIAAEKFGCTFTENQLEQYNAFYKLVIEWNKKINLTSITDPKDFAIKHIIDSISFWDDLKFSKVETVIDIGTGAGFPGIPLKIYKSNIKIILLDSLAKRIRFLETVIDKIDLEDVFIIHSRAEKAAHNVDLRESFDLAISRAVAKLNILAEYCLPFVKLGGHFVALKGSNVKEELIETKNAIRILGGGDIECIDMKLPNGDIRKLIYLKKNSPSPNKFPRKSGIPEKKPLI